MSITPEMARRELARRELARRQQETESQQVPQEQTFAQKLPRNVGVGLGNLARDTLNMPHDVAQSLQSLYDSTGDQFRKFPFMGDIGKAKDVAKYIPHMEEKNFPEMLGLTGEPTVSDLAIQKGVEFSPYIYGLASVLRSLPIRKGAATRHLKKAKRLANERDIPPANLSDEIFEQAPQFFNMKDPAVQNLISEAMGGEYNPVFDLQSALGQQARGYARSSSQAERSMSPFAERVRQQLLNEYKGHLSDIGEDKIVKHLTKGQDKYRQYMKLKRKSTPVLKSLGYGGGVLGGAAALYKILANKAPELLGLKD